MTQLFIQQPNGRYREATLNEVAETAHKYAIQSLERGITVRSPNDTEDFLMKVYAGLQAEKFGIMHLDNRHRLIAFETPFNGTVDGTSVYPRELVKRALELNAAAVILSHNHPSGTAEPSQADERITRRIKAAMELVEKRVLDHIVVGSDQCTSLASRGLL